MIDGVKAVVIQPRQMLDAHSNRALLHRQGGDYVCNPCAAGSSEAILMVGGDGCTVISADHRMPPEARCPAAEAESVGNPPGCPLGVMQCSIPCGALHITDAMHRSRRPQADPGTSRFPGANTLQTYTLAISDGVLFACLPDEADISAAITDATAVSYGFGLNLDIVRGATLTDAARPEDEVLWQEGSDSELLDAAGRRFRYAVRRPS